MRILPRPPVPGDLLRHYRRSLKARPAPEAVNAVVFRPLGYLVARGLLGTPVRPIHLVLLHTCLGIVAGLAILAGRERWAAAVLQVVTVLDNADGQLARLRGEETELGRYADTELDAVKNAVLLAAIGRRIGRVRRAALAFVVLTAVLSWDFNVEYLYRAARGERFRPEVRDEDGFWLMLARSIYRALFAPQDRAIRWLERQAFRCSTGCRDERSDCARAWWGREVVWLGANLGLSTQYVWLGIFLLTRRLETALAFLLGQAAVPVLSVVVRWLVFRCRRRRSP
ncbi:MAG: CDP-alcohol phosphatidyltransferase family protein [Thermomicrobium sp.]|nr:CDP-alcohol phosphatidyltransferase family protein [Thermomicrobium sp.]MDW8058609.1 CDP-alcohol phosphatidyltransferase family protein [Thermomicrobium sp.]